MIEKLGPYSFTDIWWIDKHMFKPGTLIYDDARYLNIFIQNHP